MFRLMNAGMKERLLKMASKNTRVCILMRGYAGSGKSSKAIELAKEYNAAICSADHYWMVDGKYCFDKDKIHLAHADCFSHFKEWVKQGQNVIIDNTNLKFEDIQKYTDYLIINNNVSKFIYAVDICEVTFNSIEDAIKCRSNRDDGKNIPIKTMYDMEYLFNRIKAIPLFDSTYKNKIDFIFERRNQSNQFFENFYSENPDKYPAVICDLDGTLALHKMLDGTSLRNPYDASKSANDIINVAVAKTISALSQTGHEILFVTGRSKEHEEPTREFIERVVSRYNIGAYDLIMRETGDNRSDAIVKNELYCQLIEPNYNVLAVFDDRPKVVSMWRAIGLMVFDCNYLNEDF